MMFNGQMAGRLPSGGSFYVDRPPGNYLAEVPLGWNGVANPTTSFTVEAGQTVYLRLIALMTGYDFKVVPPDVALAEIRETQLQAPSGAMVSGVLLKEAKLVASDNSQRTVGSLFDAPRSAPAQPSSLQESKSGPQMGRIYIYRPSRRTGSAFHPAITLNGEVVVHPSSGESFYVDRPPGDYVVEAAVSGMSNGLADPIRLFTLNAGQSVYVRFIISGYRLEVVPPEEGAEEISRMNPARSLNSMIAKATVSERGGITTMSMTPDEAERILERRSENPSPGLYALDEQTAFNVLDSVYYDPASKVLSLVGHTDNRYTGPKTPYLQHLAVLLHFPKPEFSLNWTPESEHRIDAFFSEHTVEGLSSSEADNLMAKWGQVVDGDLKVTHSGELLLTAMGLSPVEGRRAPGFAGMAVGVIPGTVWLKVTNVLPGSAGAAAGLEQGDVIKLIRGKAPLTPYEFGWRVRMSGEGQTINLTYERPGSGGSTTTTQLTPTASPDQDPWKDTSAYDLLKTLYWASGDPKAAYVIDIAGKMYRTRQSGSAEVSNELRGLLINALGIRRAVNADLKAIDENTMTEIAAFRDIYLKICQGMDETFHFSGTPVGDAFLESYRRLGGDPGFSVKPAFEEFSRQMVPKVRELLNVIFERPEGVQIPPELVDEQFHVKPEMVPEYLGLPEDSSLARVLFSSDYLCKRLMNRPDLKARIPAYQTGFEFEVKHPEFRHASGNYRIWISVAKMDTPQSPSGTTLALRDLKMRFNIRDHEGGSASGSAVTRGGRDLPNRPGSYEDLLTSLWDSFEVEYPTLHELRETAKLAAAARWILAHDPKASLPEEGRVHWQGPRKVPGLVFMELAPDPTQGMSKTHVTTIAEGGVSAAPPADFTGDPYPSDPSVVDLRGTSFGGPPAGARIYTATAPSQGASDTASSPLSMGWVGPLDASDGAKSAVVVTSTFGSKVVKVDFSGEKKASGVVGANTKAGDQLKAAATTARSGGNLTQNFDVGGAREAGSLPAMTVDSSEIESMKAWEKMKNHPRMARLVPLLEAYSQLQAKREQLNTERDELTLKRNQAKDTATLQQLSAELEKKDKEYQDNLVALAAKKDEVAKVKRMIDTSEEGGGSVPDASKPHEAPEVPAVPIPTPNSVPAPPEEPRTPMGGGGNF